jgi:DNA modification methylase
MPTLPSASVQCCVTSPPYFGLRNYGVDGQIGLETSPDAYVAELVAVFREVRRVLRPDGTCWVNIGDSYSDGGTGANGRQRNQPNMNRDGTADTKAQRGRLPIVEHGLAAKQLLMIPARVALALQADGWLLRSAITWCKSAPMPESVTDRPTSATEMVYLLAKSPRYFFDQEAIREPSGANARNWWVISPQPFSGSHFAVMPATLVERCIKAGSRPGDTILDPFSGAGTTCLVADRLGRDGLGIELNPVYSAMAHERVVNDCPLFVEIHTS